MPRPETDADRRNLIETDWSVDVDATPTGGGPTAFRAIFDEPTEDLGDLETTLAPLSSAPILTARTIDVAGIRSGDPVTVTDNDSETAPIGLGSFVVTENRPDGTGISILVLQAAS